MRKITDWDIQQHGAQGPYKFMAEIIAANEKLGRYFFSPETMRKFGSIYYAQVILGRYFVTSERDRGVRLSDGSLAQAHEGKRLFTVRRCEDNGSINNVGREGQFQSYAQAANYALGLLDQSSPCANCGESTYNRNFTCDDCKGASSDN